jgi:hypothetical protein
MPATLSDTLAACARELEHVSDQFAEQGLPTNHISAASALLHTIAERAAAPEHPSPIGEELAADVADAPHPREVLALSGKKWDFSLPGCKTFGCIDGLTDAEVYAEHHHQLIGMIAALEPKTNISTPGNLLEATAARWDSLDESDPRWSAALYLIQSLGHTEPNDQERYAAFAAIPGMAAELVIALDDAEYHEYCRDQVGVPAREARAVSDQAQLLADRVRAWADSL